MCPPASPTTAESMAIPAIFSARSTASATASAARSISMMAPLRTPRETASPTPRTRRPAASMSATAQQTLVVPRSSAKTWRGRLTSGLEYSRGYSGKEGLSATKPQDVEFPAGGRYQMLDDDYSEWCDCEG